MSTPLFGAQTLAIGHTSIGVLVPFRCGDDGSLISGLTTAVLAVGPKSPSSFYGRTSGGENVAILVDADGKVQTT